VFFRHSRNVPAVCCANDERTQNNINNTMNAERR